MEFKTQTMVNNKPGIEQYANLNPKQLIKLLDVMLHVPLKWKDHIQYMVCRLNKAYFYMLCFTKITSLETIMVVYYSYFQSITSCGVILWGNNTNCNIIF